MADLKNLVSAELENLDRALAELPAAEKLACQHAIIALPTRDALAPYLAFRHFITHAYGFDLDPARIQPLLENVETVSQSLKADWSALLK